MSKLRMPYGKYKGQLLDDVPASYLLWYHENVAQPDGAVKTYIVKNMAGIKKQIADGNGDQ